MRKILSYIAVCLLTILFISIAFIRITDWKKDRRLNQRLQFDNPDGFANHFNRIKSKPGKQSTYHPNYAYTEFLKATKHTLSHPSRNKKSASLDISWVQRGPHNVGGRTRSILVDPINEDSIWYAGSVSGGIWKTTNAGASWINITPNIPNLSTTTLTMAPSNSNVIYAGTGEGYGGFGMVMGNGILVSTDRGNSWTLIESTSGNRDFSYINKIIVAEDDENILVVATNKGILKSVDGGDSWNRVYYKGHAVQDIISNPLHNSTLYAAVNRLGIIKSFNTGDTWFNSFEGMGIGKRFSIAVSPIDTSYVFSAAEVNSSRMDIYISSNSGVFWRKHNDAIGSMINFHGVQGWFNNVIEPHPYDKRKLFVGGVYLGMVEFKSNTFYSGNQITRVDTTNTGSFLGFINFGGAYLDGGLATGLQQDANVDPEDFTSIKVYFGEGRSQKAHRFIVPAGEGSGVPDRDYIYQDYINVPFEVWDTDNNKQLMVSFRDQERDGSFNLVEREFDNDTLGREYFFVHAIEYSGDSSATIAVDGGHIEKMLYFFWPILLEDKTWTPDSLPQSTIEVKYDAFQHQDLHSITIADKNKNENLHVDHHDLHIIPVNEAENIFTIINANDGGVAVSYNSGTTWEQLTNGYITTQFYGIAKKPGEHEYIGGMQDNGTWQSPWNSVATGSSEYDFRIEGDGFEALWHPYYPKRIIGSSYNNLIRLSMDGGETWDWITEGLGIDGPFITRLSHSQDDPNVIFAVGSRGVYRHVNFGTGKYDWQLTELDEGWSLGSGSESSHLVEVSLANPEIVWVGQGMYEKPDLSLFVSKDQGITYTRTENYNVEKMGYLSGLATHPKKSAMAYALFSMQGEPKILQTNNYGDTWEDISGFGLDSSSSTGFPDVAVFSLLVMPFNTQIIWAGTEIGIFESIDGGSTWQYADNGMPAVSIWQMDIIDNTIIVATHGRGIWSADITALSVEENVVDNSEIIVYPNPASDHIYIQTNQNNTLNSTYQIISMDGKVVQAGQTVFNSDDNVFIQLKELPSGSYFLQINMNGSYIDKQFLIK